MCLNIKYCYEQCSKGNTASDKFLELNNSVFDAAVDFQLFTEACFCTCPYKAEHIKNESHAQKVAANGN